LGFLADVTHRHVEASDLSFSLHQQQPVRGRKNSEGQRRNDVGRRRGLHAQLSSAEHHQGFAHAEVSAVNKQQRQCFIRIHPLNVCAPVIVLVFFVFVLMGSTGFGCGLTVHAKQRSNRYRGDAPLCRPPTGPSEPHSTTPRLCAPALANRRAGTDVCIGKEQGPCLPASC
jgi:hypothetical protein